MATYHLNVRKVSKGQGQSAKAKSDYINREDKYSARFEDLRFSESGNMPKFAENNPEKFWEMADIYERSNARVCTEIEFALPRELTLEQNTELVRSFINKTIDNDNHNLPYSFAIHNDKDNHNPHCHLIFSERHNDKIERSAEQFFKRANSKNAELGGAKKSKHAHSKEFVQEVRTTWRQLANEHLAKNGHSARIDERTLEAQGIDREPSRRINRVEWKEVRALEQQSRELEKEIAKTTKEITSEKRLEDLKTQGMGTFQASFTSAFKFKRKDSPENASKSSIEQRNEKPNKKQAEHQKMPEKRKQSVLQEEFDEFMYKTFYKAEARKYEPTREIAELEKKKSFMEDTRDNSIHTLERIQNEKWGLMGLYQTKEQKEKITSLKAEIGGYERRINSYQETINEKHDWIKRIEKENQPIHEKKRQMMKDNPDLVEKTQQQLRQEHMARSVKRWEQQEKSRQLSRGRSRDEGLSL